MGKLKKVCQEVAGLRQNTYEKWAKVYLEIGLFTLLRRIKGKFWNFEFLNENGNF